jgi:hypothetical protein
MQDEEAEDTYLFIYWEQLTDCSVMEYNPHVLNAKEWRSSVVISCP